MLFNARWQVENAKKQLEKQEAYLARLESEHKAKINFLKDTLHAEAEDYIKSVAKGKETKWPNFAKPLSQVFFRKPGERNDREVYFYAPASTTIALACGEKVKPTVIFKDEPRINTIERAISGDEGTVIAVFNSPIYRKEFVPVFLFFAVHQRKSVAEAIEGTKQAFEWHIKELYDHLLSIAERDECS